MDFLKSNGIRLFQLGIEGTKVCSLVSILQVNFSKFYFTEASLLGDSFRQFPILRGSYL